MVLLAACTTFAIPAARARRLMAWRERVRWCRRPCPPGTAPPCEVACLGKAKGAPQPGLQMWGRERARPFQLVLRSRYLPFIWRYLTYSPVHILWSMNMTEYDRHENDAHQRKKRSVVVGEWPLLGKFLTVWSWPTPAYRASHPRHLSIAVQLRKTAAPQRGVRRATVYPALGTQLDGFRRSEERRVG